MTTTLRTAVLLFVLVGLNACDHSGAIPVAQALDGSEKTTSQNLAPTDIALASANPADDQKGDEKSSAAEKKQKGPKKVYAPQDPTKGSLVGTVTFKGTMPKLEPIVIPDTASEKAHCAGHVKNEKIILGKGQSLQNVVLTIDGYKKREKPFHKTIKIDNIRCAYKPRVSTATSGAQLVFTNSDPFLHNIHGLLGDSFNYAVLPNGNVKRRVRKPGWIIVKCDVHPYMLAHVHVFSHNLHDVSGPNGKFKIVNIPPGEYKVRAWHERIAPVDGRIVGTIKVAAGKATKLDVVLEMPKDE